MTITIYCPASGDGISGGLYGADWRGGQRIADGEAACWPRYQFGTVFVVLDDDVENYAPSRVVTCRDRGPMIGNDKLDLAKLGGKAMRPAALAWGKRRRSVMVFKDMQVYRQFCANARRLGDDVEWCR